MGGLGLDQGEGVPGLWRTVGLRLVLVLALVVGVAVMVMGALGRVGRRRKEAHIRGDICCLRYLEVSVVSS